jgi:DUF917 family protein
VGPRRGRGRWQGVKCIADNRHERQSRIATVHMGSSCYSKVVAMIYHVYEAEAAQV